MRTTAPLRHRGLLLGVQGTFFHPHAGITLEIHAFWNQTAPDLQQGLGVITFLTGGIYCPQGLHRACSRSSSLARLDPFLKTGQ